MNKKAVLGVLAAAIAVAYGGSTWWAGSQIKSRYDAALDELPKQTALVRVTERKYERGFLGAVSTVTLEIGCAADAAASAQQPAADRTGDEEEQAEEDDGSAIKPPKQLRLTIRDTIHHGPLAGGTLAAATIDSELVLDDKAQAEAKKLFGEAKPLSARTKVGFDGAFTTDLTVAPARLAEEGKGRLDWQGMKVRMEVNAARTQARYDLSMPGLDFSDTKSGATMKMGKLTAKADMDSSAGLFLATGKTEGKLDSLEFAVRKKPAEDGAAPPKALPTVVLQGIDLVGEASIKDGLYASTGTLKGTGKIGETRIDRFELTSGARRIHGAGYRKLADAWMQSSAASGCGKGGSKASQAAMQALAEQLAPDLKAMAKYAPEAGIDKLVVEIDGKRAELGYSVGMAGVTDEDLQLPGTALMMKRGVLKAHARLPMKWLEKLAETGAESGQTPPPEMVAGLVEQGEESGFVKRDGDDVTAQAEFSDGSLKVNGKPLGGMGSAGK
ncbi:YdgA family protein [Variovorax sp. CAN2819]|uniref:YdgA family protein n=1 Tax=Variovorax sp. CAN15 TaxID=3046727 RepID=UPI002648FA3F|nr:YdgA family protein [Variovorax sp. CAN15]MDN6884437.1 YdgA family protein [Variovorax sp. CAN15]